MPYLAIALGGALGAVARYLFPYGTLGVNLLGAFGLACFNGWLVGREVSQALKLFVTTGFMGAFTTFSTLSVISIQTGQITKAFTYSLGSLGLGLIVAALGFQSGRWLGKQEQQGSEARE